MTEKEGVSWRLPGLWLLCDRSQWPRTEVGWDVLLLTKLALSDESCHILCTHHSLGLTRGSKR